MAIGVGPECEKIICDLQSAPWFKHLQETFVGPEKIVGSIGLDGKLFPRVFRFLPQPHIASIAMSELLTAEDVDLACAISRLLMQCHTFVVITSASTNPKFVTQLGQACNCLIGGDGSHFHHEYPARTISEPASGRLVCYDLHDVCCIWDGHLGGYGSVWQDADALHVEVSTKVRSLADVEKIVDSYRVQLNEKERVGLFNVVDGIEDLRAVPVSFRRYPILK